MSTCHIDSKAQTDLFEVLRVDHLEFTVGDAISAMKILKRGLGMELIGESKKETGNHSYCSFVLKTDTIKFVVTSPYLSEFKHPHNKVPYPAYDAKRASEFFHRHGNGVSSIGVEVADCEKAFKIATANGAKGLVSPITLTDETGAKVTIAEIEIYSELESKEAIRHSLTSLRFLQFQNYNGPFIPGYRAVKDPNPLNYGLARIDHIVGNVYDKDHVVNDFKKWFGFHTFAKFTKEDIQTPWTALNSEVLANNNLKVLLPINESAPGKKESQILEYLKAYNGPGVQHIALKTSNVFTTVSLIQQNSDIGFEFIPTPAPYYDDPVIQSRMKEYLSEEEAAAVKKLGILVDLDDEGLLLQIFTKPLFDRPTLFIEIIQRKCKGEKIAIEMEIPGCGGFGKGNFKALFESIEILQKERGGLLDAAGEIQC